MGIEIQFLNFLQTLHTPFLDQLMIIFTKLGDAGIVWIILTIIMLMRKETRKVGWMMAAALIIFHISCNVIIKPIVARPRPYTVNPDVKLLVKKLKDYSFPSGHTAASFAMVVVLFVNKMKKLGLAAFLLALAIGFSRLYLYVHFPTDVLAGVVLGLITGWLGCMLVTYIERRKRQTVK